VSSSFSSSFCWSVLVSGRADARSASTLCSVSGFCSSSGLGFSVCSRRFFIVVFCFTVKCLRLIVNVFSSLFGPALVW